MDCPHCSATATTERPALTAQGYRRYRCLTCKRDFNERTGTIFNRLQYPTDLVCLVVLWRLRYKLSLRDLAEMFLDRGIEFCHDAVHEWESKLANVLAEGLRVRRRGKAGVSWYVDETYIKVKGRWCYLYRAIDRDGRLIDVRLSETRDMAAAKAFFASALSTVGSAPDRVTTDGHDSYPKAINDELGSKVKHRTNQYLNNRLEQDHRGIKGRYQSMRGFKSFLWASRFCRAHDELRNAYRYRRHCNEKVSLSQQRQHHQQQFTIAMNILQAA